MYLMRITIYNRKGGINSYHWFNNPEQCELNKYIMKEHIMYISPIEKFNNIEYSIIHWLDGRKWVIDKESYDKIDSFINNSLPQSVWDGSFVIFGVNVKCCVLNDGRRIIEADSMNELLEAMEKGGNKDPGQMEQFAQWQKGGIK